jgi:hypothetical protein
MNTQIERSKKARQRVRDLGLRAKARQRIASGAGWKGEEQLETSPHPVNEIFNGRIPGVFEFTLSLTEAQEKGMLFFLAVEIELLVESYLEQNVTLPTSVEWESLLIEAVKTLKRSHSGSEGGSAVAADQNYVRHSRKAKGMNKTIELAQRLRQTARETRQVAKIALLDARKVWQAGIAACYRAEAVRQRSTERLRQLNEKAPSKS